MISERKIQPVLELWSCDAHDAEFQYFSGNLEGGGEQETISQGQIDP